MKKTWKSVIALVLVVAMVLPLAGCGATFGAKRAVKGMFRSFTKLNFTAAEKYVDLEGIQLAGLEEDMPIEVELFLRYMLSKMSYDILSVEEINENAADVTTEITAVDPGPMLVEFLAKFMKFSLSSAFSDEEVTDKDVEKKIKEILKEIIKDEDLKMTTFEVTLRVNREDKKWKVAAGDTLVASLFGDLKGSWEELSQLIELFQ